MRPLDAILLLTHDKNEKYIDDIVALIHVFWQDHPKLWVITDLGNFKYPYKVVVKDKNWVTCNHTALLKLVEEGLIDKNSLILLLLEDHVPVEPVNASALQNIGEVFQKNSVDYLSLTGFGRETTPTFYTTLGIPIFQISSGFKYYNELHPAIWRVSHLLEMFELAREQNINNPWLFEFLKPIQKTHYTTPNLWTSVFSGFLVGGFVTKDAIQSIIHPLAQNFKIKLHRNFILQRPKYFWMKLKRSFQTGKIRQFIQHFQR